MYAIFVTIKIKPGFAEKFKEASLGDAQGSVRDEPGCLRFDMHQSTTDPNTFHLYEVYENQDAHLNAHRSAPHYQKWRETVQDWFDGEPQRFAMTTVFPSDAGWRTAETRAAELVIRRRRALLRPPGMARSIGSAPWHNVEVW